MVGNKCMILSKKEGSDGMYTEPYVWQGWSIICSKQQLFIFSTKNPGIC